MPELPEVETVKKALLKKVQNKKILNIKILPIVIDDKVPNLL